MKHNVYYDGKIQSLGFDAGEGYTTVGVVTPGAYSFPTEHEEHVVVLAGTLKFKLPGEQWRTVGKNETLIIPAKVTFEVAADAEAAYICYFK